MIAIHPGNPVRRPGVLGNPGLRPTSGVGSGKDTPGGSGVKGHQKKKGVKRKQKTHRTGADRKQLKRLEVMTEAGVKRSWHRVGVGVPSQDRVKDRRHGEGNGPGS